jgi:hypothetical protein
VTGLRRFALTLTDFAGHWRLSRSIDDHRSGTTGVFEGTADFAPSDNGLTYVEIGLLHLTGQQPLRAERRYLWTETEDGITITFADGRPFHSFRPGAPEATHWCDLDTYDVIYDFAQWPIWRSTWTVSGPRKAYKMISTYTRPDP